MKKREYFYAGERIELSQNQAAAFTLAIQKSILASLYKRDIITFSQVERCMAVLQKQKL